MRIRGVTGSKWESLKDQMRQKRKRRKRLQKETEKMGRGEVRRGQSLRGSTCRDKRSQDGRPKSWGRKQKYDMGTAGLGHMLWFLKNVENKTIHEALKKK